MLYKQADAIFNPLGLEILAILQDFINSGDLKLQKEAKQAYKEWQSKKILHHNLIINLIYTYLFVIDIEILSKNIQTNRETFDFKELH